MVTNSALLGRCDSEEVFFCCLIFVNGISFGAVPVCDGLDAIQSCETVRRLGGEGIRLDMIGNRGGLMVVGDLCKMPNRERCFEARTLKPGHLAMLEGGNLHSLINPSDEDQFLA
jgi:hypothetical protein